MTDSEIIQLEEIRKKCLLDKRRIMHPNVPIKTFIAFMEEVKNHYSNYPSKSNTNSPLTKPKR